MNIMHLILALTLTAVLSGCNNTNSVTQSASAQEDHNNEISTSVFSADKEITGVIFDQYTQPPTGSNIDKISYAIVNHMLPGSDKVIQHSVFKNNGLMASDFSYTETGTPYIQPTMGTVEIFGINVYDIIYIVEKDLVFHNSIQKIVAEVAYEDPETQKVTLGRIVFNSKLNFLPNKVTKRSTMLYSHEAVVVDETNSTTLKQEREDFAKKLEQLATTPGNKVYDQLAERCNFLDAENNKGVVSFENIIDSDDSAFIYTEFFNFIDEYFESNNRQYQIQIGQEMARIDYATAEISKYKLKVIAIDVSPRPWYSLQLDVYCNSEDIGSFF